MTTILCNEPATEITANDVAREDRRRHHYCDDWTPEFFKAQAAECLERRYKSIENCDTDGFMSQWANGEMAWQYERAAAIVAGGYLSTEQAVFDLDGNVISVEENQGQYGAYWWIPSREGKERYFTPSKARSEKTALRNNARKGCVLGRRVVKVALNSEGMDETVERFGADKRTLEKIAEARQLIG